MSLDSSMGSFPPDGDWLDKLYEQYSEEVQECLKKIKYQWIGLDGILKDGRTGRAIPLSELSDVELISFAAVLSFFTPEDIKEIKWPVEKVRQDVTAEIRRRGLPHPGD